MYDYAKCDEQLRSCLTTPLKFELHFTHISRTVGSLKVRTQGWKRVVEGGKGVTVHKLTHVSNTLSLFPLETFRFLQCAHNNEEDAQQRRRKKVTCFVFISLIHSYILSSLSSRDMQDCSCCLYVSRDDSFMVYKVCMSISFNVLECFVHAHIALSTLHQVSP